MEKVTATYVSEYVKNGNTVFIYKVTGTSSALTAYEDAKGEYYRVDEATGDVLYFTTRFMGDKATLVINDKGNIYPDMSEFNKAASLAKQFGGNLGQELARIAASKLMGTSASASVPATQQGTPIDLKKS